jgi:ABC-type spermidine/putrescine transport system permease subunit II
MNSVLRFFALATVGVLVLPTLILGYIGLNASQFADWEFAGLTSDSFLGAIRSPQFVPALLSSLSRGVIVCVMSLAIGLVFTVAYLWGAKWTRRMIGGALVILFACPPTSYCLHLLYIARACGLGGGSLLVILGQLQYAVPLSTILLVAGLGRGASSEYEAALVLGAPWPIAFFRFLVLKRLVFVMAAASTALYLSVDDLTSCVYLRGANGAIALTEYIWRQMQTDVTPVIAWESIGLTLVCLVLFVPVMRLVRKENA